MGAWASPIDPVEEFRLSLIDLANVANRVAELKVHGFRAHVLDRDARLWCSQNVRAAQESFFEQSTGRDRTRQRLEFDA
jgi:hypothetical protein